MSEKVYKVCSASDWNEATAQGRYLGSADDRRDGFIHLSTGAQLSGTLARHFSGPDGRGLPGLVLLSFDPRQLGPDLKWEPARDGSLFPHLYGALETALALDCVLLDVGPDGRHIIPGDLA